MTQRVLAPAAPRTPPSLPSVQLTWPAHQLQPQHGPIAARWRIHDRTHLELPIEYDVRDDKAPANYEWDAYFFAPRSFRVDRLGYDRDALLADFRSYVRLSLPRQRLNEVTEQSVDALARELEGSGEEEATRALRLFACRVRGAVVQEHTQAVKTLERGGEHARKWVGPFVAVCTALPARLHAMVEKAPPASGSLTTARRWVEEDVALMLELLLSGLARRAKRAQIDEEVQQQLVDGAVWVARHRRRRGLEAHPAAALDARQIEHIEFRRHTLKRFSSSVLWLKLHSQEPARFVRQLLYAIAAGIAMSFAVGAALVNGPSAARDQLPTWLVVAVLAYAIKDRLKASLQATFGKLLSRKTPDRRWLIRAPDSSVELAKLEERTRFVDFEQLPEAVLKARRATRQHPIEEVARPETVLWHRKTASVDPAALRAIDAPCHALMEIFRLDLTRWLMHTDDPRQRLTLADPDTHAITSVVAPRVYNIAVVFRIRRQDDDSARWHRVRVVVSRNGLRRIEPIS